MPQEDRLFLKDDVTTESWADRFIRRIERNEALSFVAETDGRIVAEATLYRPQHGWSAHVGELRVAVARSHRRRGLATILAGMLVKVATDQGADKIVVEVVENQVPALCQARLPAGGRPSRACQGHPRRPPGPAHPVQRRVPHLGRDGGPGRR
jgi:GNAT superfamily N-acetyltransferase